MSDERAELERLRKLKRVRELEAKAAGASGAQLKREPVDQPTAFARGAGQGATLGFGDEINGLIQALGEKYLPESAGGGGPQASVRTLGDLYRGNRDSFRRENADAERAHGGYYLGGNVAGGLPLSIATSGGSKATLGSLMKSGAMLGAPAGLGSSSADLTHREVGGSLFDTALGGAFGAGSGAAGYLLAKVAGAGTQAVSTKAAQKAAEATERITQLAKDSASRATQSARSVAGNTATAAYKNATNIEEAIKAGAMTLEDLTPEQLTLYRSLLKERGGKAAQDLAADAARKTAKGEEYAQVLASLADRETEAAARIGNPMNQLKPWLGRYWPVLAGGTAGALFGDSVGAAAGLGGLSSILGLGGLGGGALAGGGLRPSIHALMRRASHPSVQRAGWNTLGALARGVGYGTGAAAPMLGAPSSRALTPEVEQALMPLLLAAGGSQDSGRPVLATVPSPTLGSRPR